MPPVEFSVVNAMGIMEAKRVQVPLVLSYALSIHKSQGQTLQRVKIDLGGTFEMGQAYVALSRATSLQTLQVLNFNQYKVMADRRVIEWSKTLRVHRPGEDSEPEEAGEMSEDEEEDEDEDEEQYVEEYEEEEGEDEFFGTAPELNRDSQTVIEISDEDDAMEICSESGETQEEDDF
ncbi:hypothetical protein FRB90_006435 [Tulasnella sp. 427]|nr:hypothetical protein FRB90_006435 [Tulasnella sp. 427]